MKTTEPILLVEDDQVDAMIVERALKEIKITNRLDVAHDGEKALARLMDAHTEKPCLILLDLNMPRMNGLELLSIIKQHEILKKIPVIILTSSGEEQDKLDSFKWGVAGYIIKPVEYQQFVEIMRTIDSYWSLSELPRKE